MDWQKLIREQDGEWLLREEDSPFGLEVYFESSGSRPTLEKCELAEFVLRELRHLAHIGADYLSTTFRGEPLHLTTEAIQIMWLQIPEVSALNTGTFGLVFIPEFDPYLQLTVWFDATPDNSTVVQPKHCTFRWA